MTLPIKIFISLCAVALFLLAAALFRAPVPVPSPTPSSLWVRTEEHGTSSAAIVLPPEKEEEDRVVQAPPPRLVEPIVIPPSVTPLEATSSPPENNSLAPSTAVFSLLPPPPLEEQALLKAVVKIECPLAGGLGKYIGSGFVLGGGVVMSAAHVVVYSAEDTCTVIFPRERRPIHYLRGVIDKKEEAKRWYEEQGIDVAMLTLPDLASYPEGRAIFERYPSIPYSICRDPEMSGDTLLHYGYPSNYLDQNYLSRLQGTMTAFTTVTGMRTVLSQDQTFLYRAPAFATVKDMSSLAPYAISLVPSFYGDSGGLAFNATKQCILGPHHGGTIGKSEGENYTIFSMLGWEGIRGLEGL